MQKTDLKSDRDKQVQVRLPASLHKQLKLALIQDDSSLADFFNEAAEAYLKNQTIRICLMLSHTIGVFLKQFLLLVSHGGFELFFVPANQLQ